MAVNGVNGPGVANGANPLSKLKSGPTRTTGSGYTNATFGSAPTKLTSSKANPYGLPDIEVSSNMNAAALSGGQKMSNFVEASDSTDANGGNGGGNSLGTLDLSTLTLTNNIANADTADYSSSLGNISAGPSSSDVKKTEQATTMKRAEDVQRQLESRLQDPAAQEGGPNEQRAAAIAAAADKVTGGKVTITGIKLGDEAGPDSVMQKMALMSHAVSGGNMKPDANGSINIGPFQQKIANVFKIIDTANMSASNLQVAQQMPKVNPFSGSQTSGGPIGTSPVGGVKPE